MSDHRTLTRRWLRQNITPYSNQDIVYSHVDSVLAAHPTLRPKTDVYIFDDGRSQLMLCIHGLLPIVFRGSTYNIPVSIWLPHTYPSEAPIVYVVPTSDMLVRASKLVDLSGRCNFPYTQQWQLKSEGCHLAALVDVLVDAFSNQPPVYAKPTPSASSAPSPTPPSAPDYSTRPIPTLPTDGSRPSPPTPLPPAPPPPHTRPRTQSPRPALPPHPHEPRHYRTSSTHIHSSPAQDPPMYTTPSPRFTLSPTSSPHPPPPPPRPPQLPHSQPSIFVGQSTSPLRPTQPPFPQSHPYLPPQLQPQPQSWQHPPQQPPSSYASHQSFSSGPPIPPPSNPVRNYLEEDLEDIPAASQAPPPPRPPNPEILRLYDNVLEKLNSEYSALEYALNTDLQRLRTAQSDLLAGEAAIHDEMGRLQAVRDVCRTVADRYQATIIAAEANLSELRKKGDPEVDELICSTSIVYNQLIDLVAEDSAIEDTIYHLHRALNAGRLDLEKFLRTTRALAEEQFMKRALAQKIVSSIPMGSWGSHYT